MFFALPIPPEALAQTVCWCEAVGSEMSGARLIPRENLHVTLNFVGETEDETVALLSRLCIEVAREAKPVQATISGLNLLPSATRPQLVYLRITEGSDGVRELSRVLGLRLKGTADRRFLAHVTVARVRGIAHSSVERLCRLNMAPARGTFRKLVLYRSQVRTGSVYYLPLQAAKLGSGK